MASTSPTTPRADASQPILGTAGRELNVLASLQAHWRLSCAVFALSALGFGLLALNAKQVAYTSSAVLHVARSFPRTLQNDRELDLNTGYDYDSFRNDQVALILRSDVLQEALVRCGQFGPPWAAAGSPAHVVEENFARAITVQAVPKSSRIEISVRSGSPDIAQPALNALLAAFQEAHRREYFFTEDERPETLRTALSVVEASIAEKRQEIENLTKRLGVTSFTAATLSPWTAALEQTRLALSAVKREAIDRHAQLEAELENMKEGHPGRAAIERRLAELEDQATSIRKHESDAQPREASMTEISEETAASLLQKELEALEASNAEFLALFQRGRILEDELPRDLSLRDRLNQRLEFFEFEAQSPSYAEVRQAASAVDLRGESNLRRNLAIALFLAGLLALGLPILLDLRDRQVHTPSDLSRIFGFAPAGWLPQADRAQALHISQTQRLAQALDRERKRHGAHLVVFTGVQSLSVLDSLRALALALRELGRRVLVVDATAEASTEPTDGSGLLGLLAGGKLRTERLESAVEFLPWGNAEQGMANWDSWAQKLATAAADFEFVLVAAPPLLSAPAAELLVADADLAVLVVAAEQQSLGEVDRARQLLQMLKPKAMGALLTNVAPAYFGA